jgi:hypothetical protein
MIRILTIGKAILPLSLSGKDSGLVSDTGSLKNSVLNCGKRCQIPLEIADSGVRHPHLSL